MIIFGGICVLLIIIIILVIIHVKNKYQCAIIKMDEAENNIDILLDKKKDLIRRVVPIIKKSLKLKEFMPDIDEIDSKEINHFELNDDLKKLYNELFSTLDNNEKLYKNKSVVELINNINENEVDLVAAIKFYNDNVLVYNNLIISFPSNIIRVFFGYKKKEFYNNEKREIYEILKKK